MRAQQPVCFWARISWILASPTLCFFLSLTSLLTITSLLPVSEVKKKKGKRKTFAHLAKFDHYFLLLSAWRPPPPPAAVDVPARVSHVAAASPAASAVEARPPSPRRAFAVSIRPLSYNTETRDRSFSLKNQSIASWWQNSPKRVSDFLSSRAASYALTYSCNLRFDKQGK